MSGRRVRNIESSSDEEDWEEGEAGHARSCATAATRPPPAPCFLGMRWRRRWLPEILTAPCLRISLVLMLVLVLSLVLLIALLSLNGTLLFVLHGFQIGAVLYFMLVLMLQACLLYTSPSPRDATLSRMPSSA